MVAKQDEPYVVSDLSLKPTSDNPDDLEMGMRVKFKINGVPYRQGIKFGKKHGPRDWAVSLRAFARTMEHIHSAQQGKRVFDTDYDWNTHEYEQNP